MRSLVFLTAFALCAACGGTPPPPGCSVDNCDGCCDAQGTCRRGDESSACGARGLACDVCVGAQVCSAGTCGSSGAGGGAATGGGAAAGGGAATGGGVGVGGGSATGGGGCVPTNCVQAGANCGQI